MCGDNSNSHSLGECGAGGLLLRGNADGSCALKKCGRKGAIPVSLLRDDELRREGKLIDYGAAQR